MHVLMCIHQSWKRIFKSVEEEKIIVIQKLLRLVRNTDNLRMISAIYFRGIIKKVHIVM